MKFTSIATLAPNPLDLYLRSDYGPDAEYVDGEIEERPVGEYDHATCQQALQQWFLQHGKEWGIRVRAELRVQVSPTRYRVPDVVVFDRNRPIEQILTHPPIAVFEVLSPEDRMPRIMRKLADYSAMGIPNMFVVEPELKRVYRRVHGVMEACDAEKEPLYGSAAHIDWQAVAQLWD